MNPKLAKVLFATAVMLVVAEPAFAQDAEGGVSMGAGIGMGIAALGGSIGQGLAAKSALEGIARNPSAQVTVLIPMILGLALIESIVLLALLVTTGIL